MAIDNKNSNSPEQRPRLPGGNIWQFVILVVLVLLLVPFINNLVSGSAGSQRLSYSQFRDEVEAGNVSTVVVSGEKITGTFRRPVGQGDGTTSNQFTTYLPSFGDAELLALLQEQDVRIETRPNQDVSFFAIILNILPLFILVWIGLLVFRSMRSQGRNIFSVGQNKAKLYKQTREHTTFEDVAGLSGAKEEIKEIIDYLKDPKRFQNLGARTPTGVLLVGPPGTGKTLIARAIAGEAGVPFYSISGSDFMEMFVGVGASRVRNLFREAKEKAPSIIFIDELDSIGRHRGAGLGGGHDEREQTLNQMLSELDGFEQNDSTIVLAATNRPDILDPALLRPGRFDRRIIVGLPTLKDRIEILKIHAANKPVSDQVDYENIAQKTPGFSGADLRNLLNEAALLSARRGKQVVEQKEINEARDKVLMGLERRNLTISEEERKLIAYHEAGHTLAAALCPQADPILKVTIIPRDMAMGVTQQLPEDERFVHSREYLSGRIVVMLGGRAAEKLVLGTSTSGAENDLKEATRLARHMVMDWGMSEKLGLMSVGDERRNVFLGEEISRPRNYSEETARLIDEEISQVLNDAYDRTYRSLEENRDKLDGLAAALIEREELEAEDVLSIISNGFKPGSDQPESEDPPA